MTMTTPPCTICAAFFPTLKDQRYGECRLHPPTANIGPGAKLGIWPRVDKEGWCRQWQSAPIDGETS